MENFKHLPEPFRIRVIEPVKRTTRAALLNKSDFG